MKNELKIGSILSILSIILGSLVQIFYTPMYMKYLGTTDYGINSLVQSIMGYISMLNLGLGVAMLKYTVRYRSNEDYEKEEKLNTLFLIIFFIIMIISIVVGIYIYNILPQFFSSKFTDGELIKTKKVFMIMMVGTSISFPMSVFSTNINSKEKYFYQKGLILIKQVLTPIIGALLMVLGYRLMGIVVLMVLVNILMNIFDMMYALKLGMKFKFGKLDFTILKEIFSFTIYIFLNAIIDKIYWGTDRIIIGKYVGPIAVGFYSIASIFNMIYMNLSTAISGVLFPRVNKMAVENKYQELSDLFIKIGRIQYILLGLISSGFIIYGKEFILLWLGEGYNDVYKIALWIMIPLTVPLIQNVGIIIMQARNMHQFRSVVYFFIAILNIVLSIAYVKKYGALGCAVSTGISFILGHIIIMNVFYLKKVKLDIILFWKNILKMSIPIVITMIIGSLLNNFIIEIIIWKFLLKLIIYTGIYLLLMWLIALNEEEKKEIIYPIKKIGNGCKERK